jgi:hypothetical protein
MKVASHIDFRSNAEKKNEYLALRRSSRASQLLGKGPIRGREME